MITASGITKRYGAVTALNGVSLNVQKGEIYGIIGPDGAGKSSLFRILTTLVKPDAGRAKVAGLDIIKDYKKIRSQIGYMPGRFSLYQDLSVEENISFFATLYGTTLKQNYHLVKDIYSHIEPFKDRKAGALSGGMKQKLALSCALIHSPKVLFLDEPTTGVDPVSRKEFWDMLAKLKAGGLTIVVSTPYMDEASRCDRIALINEGEFMDTDTPDNIIAKFRRCLISISGSELGRVLPLVRELPSVEGAYAFGDKLHVSLLGLGREANPLLLERMFVRLNDELSAKGCHGLEFGKIEPTIEDCYMYLQIDFKIPHYESCHDR